VVLHSAVLYRGMTEILKTEDLGDWPRDLFF
jgi:hypothetical protein